MKSRAKRTEKKNISIGLLNMFVLQLMTEPRISGHNYLELCDRGKPSRVAGHHPRAGPNCFVARRFSAGPCGRDKQLHR
jgi:hypothetical protein